MIDLGTLGGPVSSGYRHQRSWAGCGLCYHGRGRAPRHSLDESDRRGDDDGAS